MSASSKNNRNQRNAEKRPERADGRSASGRKRRKREIRKNGIGIAAVCVIFILVLIISLGGSGRKNVTETTAAGIAYVQSLEEKETSEVEAVLKSQRDARLQAESDQRKQELLDGTIDVWSLFGDTVILGDSRAVGFYIHDFVPESRVLAGGGDTIRNVAEHMDEIVALNPQFVFLCYGLNDVSIGFWPTKEEYVAEFEQVLAELSNQLPDTKIYVNSILPAQEVAFATEDSWRNIPDYSNAVKEMCVSRGYGWVDCDALAEDAANQDLYDIDGIHVKQEFYPLWGTQMMVTVYDDTLKEQVGDTDLESESNDASEASAAEEEDTEI